MGDFLQHLNLPENVAAISIAFVMLAGAGLAAIRLKRNRWIVMAAACLAVAGIGWWVWYTTPRTTDVSGDPQYKALFRTPLCLSEEAFVTQWGTELPSAGPAGFGSGVPRSIDEYLAHPNDWQHTPAYTAVYGTFFSNDPVPRVLAYGRPGTLLHIVKVLDEYRPQHHDHLRVVRGEIKGQLADVTLLLVGKQKVMPCRPAENFQPGPHGGKV